MKTIETNLPHKTKPKRTASKKYRPTDEEAKLYYQLYCMEKELKRVKYIGKPKMNYTSHGNFLEGLLAQYARAYRWTYVKTDVKGTKRGDTWTTTKATKGAPDVYLVGNGRVAFIEVKGKGDKLRDEQIALHKSINENGLPVFIFTGEGLTDKIREIHNYITAKH